MTIQFKELYKAYRDCRKRKRKTVNAQRYEMHLLDNLFETQASLNSRKYQPARCIRFIATKPKAREIHAADFSDRVVHHWLVPRLEKVFEPVFIHDVYSNRVGKGAHKAVDRLQRFMHSVGNQGWYLQLDMANFFNSIDRPILFKLLQQRLWASFPWLELLFEKQNSLYSQQLKQSPSLRSPPARCAAPSKGGETSKKQTAFDFNGFSPFGGGAAIAAGGGFFCPRYEPAPNEISRYYSQIQYFQRQYPFAELHIQRGKKIDVIKNTPTAFQIIKENQPLQKAIKRVKITQIGYMKDGLKRRRATQLFIHKGVELCPISKN